MTPSNPSSNAYPPFADETNIKDAVLASGLPTQARVAAILRGTFDVDEEWGFIDKVQGTPRTLDIHASTTRSWEGRQPRVDAVLDLLIECKQSASP